jgi:hypothetical protein
MKVFLLFCFISFISCYDVYERYTLSQIPIQCQQKYFQTQELLDRNFQELVSMKMERKNFVKGSKSLIHDFKHFFLRMRIKKNYFKILVEKLRFKTSIEYWKSNLQIGTHKENIQKGVPSFGKKENAMETEIEKVFF